MKNAIKTLLVDPKLQAGEFGLSHVRRTADLNGFNTLSELSRFLGVRLDDLTAGKQEAIRTYCSAIGLDEQQLRNCFPVRGPSGWIVGNHSMSQHGLRLKAPMFCPMCIDEFAKETVPNRWDDDAMVRSNLEWYVSAVKVCCRHGVRLVAIEQPYLGRDTKDTSLLLADADKLMQRETFICEEVNIDAYGREIFEWLNSGIAPHPHLKHLGIEGSALAATAIGMDLSEEKRVGRIDIGHEYAKIGYPLLCDKPQLISFIQRTWHSNRSAEDIGANLRALVNISRRADFSMFSRDARHSSSLENHQAQLTHPDDCVGPNAMAEILGFDRVRCDLFVRSNFMREIMKSESAVGHNTWVREELVKMRNTALDRCETVAPIGDAKPIAAIAKRINRGFLFVLGAVIEGCVQAWRHPDADTLMDILVSEAECREKLLPEQVPGLRGRDISSRLGIPDKFVKLLLDGKFLPSEIIVNPLNAYRTTIVAEDDFEAFDDRYIKAAEIARRVGKRAHLLERELATAGILPAISRQESGTAFYERKQEATIKTHLCEPELNLRK